MVNLLVLMIEFSALSEGHPWKIYASKEHYERKIWLAVYTTNAGIWSISLEGSNATDLLVVLIAEHAIRENVYYSVFSCDARTFRKC